MKLNDISQNINDIKGLEPSKTPKEQQQNPEIEKAAPPTRTEVDLSDRSIEFSRAAEEMHKIPKDRAQKLEDLRMKIEDESYHVDANDIATKIVRDALSNIVNPE